VHYVYLLQSQRDRGLYTGYTQDLRRRFYEHNAGKVASTQSRRPLRLIYYEAYLFEADAKGRERFLKSGAGRRQLRKQLKHLFEDQV
jgi:putative endonuclease